MSNRNGHPLFIDILAAAMLSVIATPALPAAPAAAQAVPLIPRQVLFGNPDKAALRISRDGKWLSWLAPRDGVLNIWVAPASAPTDARPMTAEKERPIRSYFWTSDSRMLLYVQDKGGDENFLLYGVNVATGEERLLTPFENTRVGVIAVSNRIHDRILVGLNNRDPRWHDVHSLDLNTGKLAEVLRADGYAGFIADQDLQLRVAARPDGNGGVQYFRVVNGAVEAQPFSAVGLEDSQTTRPAGFTADGKTLYWLDSRGRDTAALLAQDFSSGSTRILAQDARADVGGAMSDPVTGEIEAYSVNYLRNEWTALDPAVGESLKFLRGRLDGDVFVTARTMDDRYWTLYNDPATEPTAGWLYDRVSGGLTQVHVTRPDLLGAPLVPMHSLQIKARDGLTLVSYLSLPPGSDRNGDGRPEQPLPMVLNVHGGPWARDGYGGNTGHQWLANRGYAVLSVNFRGSTGFGKRFISAGDLQWGRTMHDDLIDAVKWAVDSGIAVEDKVAILGGSYGGYATLAGLAFTPTTFACGVDIVGPSNLETLLKAIPAYWEAQKIQLFRRVGDPGTEDGRALLKERSPLYSADRIVRPLLIGQGANDPRVNQRESDQIVEALRSRKVPVTYVLFPDEGHGFARPENNIAFQATAENFLQRCLGGRAEPFGNVLTSSSATVPMGAEHTPGLPEALAAR